MLDLVFRLTLHQRGPDFFLYVPALGRWQRKFLKSSLYTGSSTVSISEAFCDGDCLGLSPPLPLVPFLAFPVIMCRLSINLLFLTESLSISPYTVRFLSRNFASPCACSQILLTCRLKTFFSTLVHTNHEFVSLCDRYEEGKIVRCRSRCDFSFLRSSIFWAVNLLSQWTSFNTWFGSSLSPCFFFN